MKAIGIIGLGLIGGSMAKAITKHTDCKVYASNRTAKTVEDAIADGTVSGKLEEHFDEIDMLLVALYPADVVRVILETAEKLPKGCIVIDCTGVKTVINRELSEKLASMDLCFIGGHPMAGKEVAGYTNACDDLYEGASMILCRDKYTDDDAMHAAEGFFPKLGFSMVKITTPEEHDSVIAYTSQLAHVVSSAYIKSPTLEKRYGFSAGSFKDMTRVAKLNEEMWADLFMANDNALVSEIDHIVGHLMEFANAIDAHDRDRLVALLRDGRIRKEEDTLRESSTDRQ